MVNGRALTFADVTDHVCVHRFQGLVPCPQADEWIRKGQEMLARDCTRDNGTVIAFLSHTAFTQLRRGRPQEALRTLEEATGHNLQLYSHPHVWSRLMAELGETYRILGNEREAIYWLREARRTQQAYHFAGDLSDFTFATRARLEPDSHRARRWLAMAYAIQVEQDNRLGLVRTLLLEARLVADASVTSSLKRSILRRRDQLPALGRCPLLAKVLDRWDEWVSDPSAAENGDRFWGV